MRLLHRPAPAAGLDRQGPCLPPPGRRLAAARISCSSMPTCGWRPTPPPRWPAMPRRSGVALVSAVPRQVMGTPGRVAHRSDDQPAASRLSADGRHARFDPGPSWRRLRTAHAPATARPIARWAGMPRSAHVLHDGTAARAPFRAPRASAPTWSPAHRLASCRMYRGFAEAWAGFAKNAHEGMATPRACRSGPCCSPAGIVLALRRCCRCVPAIRRRRCRGASPFAPRRRSRWPDTGKPLAIPLHPFTVLVGLAIQWMRAPAVGGTAPGRMEGPRSIRSGEGVMIAPPAASPAKTTAGRELPGRLPRAGRAAARGRPGLLPASCAWRTTSRTRPTSRRPKSWRGSMRSRPRCSRAATRPVPHASLAAVDTSAGPASRRRGRSCRPSGRMRARPLCRLDRLLTIIAVSRPTRSAGFSCACMARARAPPAPGRRALRPPCRSSTIFRTAAATGSRLGSRLSAGSLAGHGRRRGGVFRPGERGPAPAVLDAGARPRRRSDRPGARAARAAAQPAPALQAVRPWRSPTVSSGGSPRRPVLGRVAVARPMSRTRSSPASCPCRGRTDADARVARPLSGARARPSPSACAASAGAAARHPCASMPSAACRRHRGWRAPRSRSAASCGLAGGDRAAPGRADPASAANLPGRRGPSSSARRMPCAHRRHGDRQRRRAAARATMRRSTLFAAVAGSVGALADPHFRRAGRAGFALGLGARFSS